MFMFMLLLSLMNINNLVHTEVSNIHQTIFIMDSTLASVKSIQLIGMHSFFRIKDIQINQLLQNTKNGHIWKNSRRKMAKLS